MKLIEKKFFSTIIFFPRSFFLLPFVILIAFFFLKCSSAPASIYNSDFPLTKENAKSRTSKLAVNIPQGWFAAEENENNLIELWLIKDDYSATLNFVPLNLDSTSVKDAAVDELNRAASLSQSFKKIKYGKSIQKFFNRENFEINGKKYSAYEYQPENKEVIRVAIFKFQNKFYELSAVPVKKIDLKELFRIQNSVLSSIE